MLDRDGLLERLRGLEWEDFEVKEAAWDVPKSAYTTVSAFANSSGGWLVFGVKESGRTFEVTGVMDPDRMQNAFLGTCRDTEKFSRPVEVRAKQYTLDDKVVLAFYVAPSRRFDKPVRVRMDKAWHTYIRVGARDQQCTPDEEARFLRDASYDTFDALVMDDASCADLDDQSLRWLRGTIAQRAPERAHPSLSPEEYLEEIGLARGGKVTHAAALLFGREKLVARLKPAGLLDFRLVRDRWSESVPEQRFDDREMCEGNLVQTLKALIERIIRLVPSPFALEPTTMQRQANPPEYPALREALVNLLIHQDYSDRQRTARILWYDDRTILENPGDSFVTLGEMLDGGSSDLRNPLLARLFRQAGYAEQAGTGIPAIVRTWREVEREPPEIVNEPGTKRYRLVLHWDRQPKHEDLYWKQLLGVSVSDDEARVLDLARASATIDRTRARLATGRSVRETAAALSHLVTNRLLEPLDGELDQYRLAPHLAERLAAAPPAQGAAAELVPGETGPSGDQAGTKQGPSRQPTTRQMEILDVLGTKPSMALNEIMERLVEAPAGRTLREDLLALKRRGLVHQQGHGRGSTWSLGRS